MDIKNKIWILPLLFFITMFSFGLVSAVTTINTPAASSTVSCGANTLFNVTSTDFPTIGTNLVNLTFYAQSTLTANSSWATIGTNNSVNLTLYGNVTLTNINLTNLS